MSIESFSKRLHFLAFGGVLLATIGSVAWSTEAWERTHSVTGFIAKYTSCETPEGGWGTDQEEKWITGLKGTLRTERAIGYRQDVLEPGTYEFWIEKGKGDWFHLVIGQPTDEAAPRLRAAFRLYEQDKGVRELDFQLKLTRKETKLKLDRKSVV